MDLLIWLLLTQPYTLLAIVGIIAVCWTAMIALWWFSERFRDWVERL